MVVLGGIFLAFATLGFLFGWRSEAKGYGYSFAGVCLCIAVALFQFGQRLLQ